MKNLKDSILEKLRISNNETNLEIEDIVKILTYLYGEDMTKRDEAINCIKEEIITENYKRISSTRSVKNSSNCFIEFGKLYGGENIMSVIRRLGSNYEVIFFASEINYYKKPKRHIDGWRNVQPNISPKHDEVYEIPNHSIINDICMSIFANYKA